MTGRPKKFSQAIDDLELEQDKQDNGGGDFQARLKSEYHKIEQTLASLRPHIEDLSDKMGLEAKKAKAKVENKVQENPWAAIGIAALIFFVLGLLLGSKRKN